VQPDSTHNIARRYRHLFTLPSIEASILASSLFVILICAISRYVLRTPGIYFVGSLVLAGVFLILGTEIDLLALRMRSGVASFRRLSAIAIISNSIWFLVVIVGLITFLTSGSMIRFLSLLLLGALFAVAFRAFIFGAVFYGRTVSGIPLAFVQPALVTLATVAGSSAGIIASAAAPALVGGLIAIIAVTIYLRAINRSESSREFRPLHLLQAFLNAWVIEDASNMERLLDVVSRQHVVRTDILVFKCDSRLVEVIVPGIHPGPFYPIGSSNLPADIFKMRRNSGKVPLTVHSISDHDLNLPSKREVESYVSSFANSRTVDAGNSMSAPVVKRKNKATVTGIAFGSTALLLITQAPHGMEDFPTTVRDEILRSSREIGFSETLIIDTHNSEGAKPSEEEAQDAISAANEVLTELKGSKRYNFRLGFAHSSETGLELHERDLGPAGVGLVLFELQNGARFSLCIVDANNAALGLREKILGSFKEAGLIEICTSDTHVTAAKTMVKKGYIALGEEISEEKFVQLLKALHEEAEKKMGGGSYESEVVDSSVKTIGGKLLGDFSSLLDSTISTARNGAIALAILTIVMIAVVALI